MAATHADSRSRAGPALFSYGFRPFFFAAALWAVVSMAAWVAMLGGYSPLPIAPDPVSWHVHEFLFGYLGAVIAGFLLTALPNWTGRMPVVGWPLAGLALLWLCGRFAFSISQLLPPVMVTIVDLAFPCALILFLAREITAGRNWRNLVVLALLSAFLAGNALFDLELQAGKVPAGGTGQRLALAAAVMLIALIGGRIVPSFTRNWLVADGQTRLPASPMQRFDRIALLVLLGALSGWVLAPTAHPVAALLLLAGALHAARLVRWRGYLTLREPLVWVLHLAYAFVPLGALTLGIALLTGAPDLITASHHSWTIGAIGTMTLAVMTRATLGHTGAALRAGTGTAIIYAAITAALLLRLSAEIMPAAAGLLQTGAAAAWCIAFMGFLVLYGPRLWRSRDPAG